MSEYSDLMAASLIASSENSDDGLEYVKAEV
jgi:hypothetical protein